MNSTTSDLLAGLGIDVRALSCLMAFHQDRHPIAYEQGLWGPGLALNGLPAVFVADFESPNCPEGWDTMWGYLAMTEPELLALMNYEASAEDERQLAGRCQREGLEPCVVPACSWLVREGVFETLAYPIHVLKAHAAGGVL